MGARFWVAAAMLALAGCGGPAPETQALGAGAASVQPERVDPAALRAAATDPRLARFYEARGWRAAWTPEAAADLVAAIGAAERHGLDRRAFLANAERARTAAAREAALSLAALSYAEALARGRADPARIRQIYTLARPDPDLAAGLAHALEGGGAGDWLAGLAPRDEEYRLLSQAYVRFNREASEGLRRPAPAAAPIRAATARAIERARTLAINLERRRWLEREPPATRIDVNTGAATLAYWRDGDVADRRRVVVGQPGRATPALGSPLFRLVANPTWTVPRSIERGEIARRGGAYLRRNNMVRQGGWIVQGSGPRNALGLVKFDMRNQFSIYLHDTPSKALFRGERRHASHGCVRVDDALGFARMIAEQEGVLPQWERALATRRETFVALPREIPVRLLYYTAFVEDGRVAFAADAYGWDEDVAAALGLPARRRPAPRLEAPDIGP